MPAPPLLFDVNETLLDMSALDPLFEQTFGAAHARKDWFLTFQGLWMTATLTGSFQPFDGLAAAALTMTGEHYARHVRKDDRDRIVDAMKTLPAHADAGPALELLRRSGVRIATVFVRRPGKALNPSGAKPDIVVSDLTELANNIAARRRRRLS